MEYYYQFSHYLTSSVCSNDIVHFIQSRLLTHYRIMKVVSPTSTLQRVGSVNRLVFQVNQLAN